MIEETILASSGKKYRAVPADKATLGEIVMERIRGRGVGISEATV